MPLSEKASPVAAREEYFHPQTHLHAVRNLGWSRNDQPLPQGLRGHRHDDAYEICYILSGAVDWWVGNDIYEVDVGQVFLTRPNEIHGGIGSIMHACEIYWVQLQLTSAQALAGLSKTQTALLADGYRKMRLRQFPADPDIPGLFDQMLAEMRRPTALSPIGVQAALHALLLRVLRSHDRAQQLAGQVKRYSRGVEAALRLLSSAQGEMPRVRDLAEAAGLGLSQFRQRFKEEVGFSPVQYRMRRTLQEAKRALIRGEAITALALRLGFNSSQHFATTFKKWIGMTPSRYQSLRPG